MEEAMMSAWRKHHNIVTKKNVFCPGWYTMEDHSELKYLYKYDNVVYSCLADKWMLVLNVYEYMA